ncbi:CoB--CoM heterodisulfide reductase iron-sulfur subunit A family protein [Thiobacillus sp.]|uniref:CoB--CoM heterodisulfide reductase iron-sulfur subunit A family protein n=1 Tax=Thiobacillus sp. TaxID=924 RepID=UPI0025CC91FE|nr:CoB--CoM heterodisulfide reductase iron-sulfur subunit A family protein [Thiobacillus sp.]MBT9539445.1 CoB--CoM heterodisulfide reductase iron-sulfur subunit A family protein [Thiobacillus sp.]
MTDIVATNETILVVGGGISGMTAALEAAETGKNVVLVEKNPALGGRTSQLYRYFPKLCHPTCGLEINQRRLKNNPRIRVLTLAEVTGLEGSTGDYTASIKVKPRYVNENCTGCGDCGRAVSMEVPDPFNYNLGTHKAAYLPNAMAYPQRYVLDPGIIGSADADKAKAACKYGAIDLDMKEETIQVKAGAVIWATGWQPYDAAKIQPYGYGRFKNVITSVEFERLADIHGPTGGKILRPGDGKEAKNIAFIQCAGSRDENHLRHCSRICCMASLKQTHYVREKYPEDGKSTIYYIDIRAIDRFEDFYQKVQADASVSFIKSKVAKVTEDEHGNPVCHGVDTEGYKRYTTPHDLVVLAVGMEPSVKGINIPGHIVADSSGFIEADPANGAVFGAGCATNALDVNRAVQSATAAALRAIQVVNKVAKAEA